MERESSFVLDTDIPGRDPESPAARVAVIAAYGFTRDGGAPTITPECASESALQGEVRELKRQLDVILEEAAAHFGGAPEPPAEPAQERAKATELGKPHLDQSLKVGDVMTREVETVRRNDPIVSAQRLMDARRFRHVVVLEDDDDSLAGVISHRDIAYAALAWTFGVSRTAHEDALESVPAKDVMHSDTVTIDAGMGLADAARLMIDHKVGCLPVIEGRRVVGILTEGDFLALIA